MDAKGQGLLEAVIVLPFMFTLVILLFRFNMGIQMAINNVQYARSQLYLIAGNSPEYPRLLFRTEGANFYKNRIDMMLLGVADPTAIEEAANGGDMPAIPQSQRVGKKGLPGATSDPGEGKLRSEIQIRETSAICTQLNGVNENLPYDSYGVVSLKPQLRWPFGKIPCQYQGQWIGGLDE